MIHPLAKLATTDTLMALVGLGGCGKLGHLERPGPAQGVDAGPDATRAVRTVDPRDRNADPAPSRSAPIDSTNDPGAVAPAGALDDPYARPK